MRGALQQAGIGGLHGSRGSSGHALVIILGDRQGGASNECPVEYRRGVRAHLLHFNFFPAAIMPSTAAFVLPMWIASPTTITGRFRKVYSCRMYMR